MTEPLVPDGEGSVLREDAERLPAQKPEVPPANFTRFTATIFWSNARRSGCGRHTGILPTILCSIFLIDGVLAGGSGGISKNGPYVLEDVHVDLPEEEKAVPPGRNHHGGVRGKRPGKKSPFALI